MDDHTQTHATGSRPDPAPAPPSWADSVADLVGSRIALIQAEARQAAANSASRLIMLAIAVFLAGSAWLLLMAAVVGVLHIHAGFPWYWGCLSLGTAHLLATAALVRGARNAGAPAFEHTLAEFKKDREWLQNLQQSKSRN